MFCSTVASILESKRFATRSGVARNFKRRRAIISTFFFKRIFFGRTNLKLTEKQERLYGGTAL